MGSGRSESKQVIGSLGFRALRLHPARLPENRFAIYENRNCPPVRSCPSKGRVGPLPGGIASADSLAGMDPVSLRQTGSSCFLGCRTEFGRRAPPSVRHRCAGRTLGRAGSALATRRWPHRALYAELWSASPPRPRCGALRPLRTCGEPVEPSLARSVTGITALVRVDPPRRKDLRDIEDLEALP
jgi:hypothetical protein